MTSICRFSRIAAQKFNIHYNKDGTAYRYPKPSATIAEYINRMAAMTASRGSPSIMKAAFELFRYSIHNTLPIKRNPGLRYFLIFLLSRTVHAFPHPMILTIAHRYLDCMDEIKGHSDYVRGPDE